MAEKSATARPKDQGAQTASAGGHAGAGSGRHFGQGVARPDSGLLQWLRRLWVDGGYAGDSFAQWVKELRPKLEVEVEVVKRSDDAAGFKVLPRRWVVERTFGWLMRQRRLVRDYERTETSAEAWILIAMIRLQLRRPA